MVTLLRMFCLSRVSSRSGLTEMKTYRSPGGPPLRPALPSDLTLSLDPVATPAGTRSEIRLLRLTRPSPPHAVQGVDCCPAPPHVGHVLTCWKFPRGVRATDTTCPVPPHVPHVVGLVPGLVPLPSHVPQPSSRTHSSSVSTPNTASRKSTSRSNRSSSPCTGLFRCARPAPPMPPMPPAPPKKLSKRSKGFEKSPMPAAPGPPKPPMPPFRPASPNWS
mmetsp:Transcript_21760/g.73947  ORF Transcript_21760/g.73947 Transcript_21760/m.73947 type:complete len:219 (+) Transcript_21760:269-925(+)